MSRKKAEPVLITDVEIPEIFAGLERKSPASKRRREDAPLKSIAFGACPGCSAQRIGLVRQGAHLAWRDHTYRTHGGSSVPCSVVGLRLCDQPARDASAFSTDRGPTCPCTR